MADAISSGTTTGSRIVYEGGRNVTYDLTGSDTRFSGETFLIAYEPNQLITLPQPVYYNEKFIVYKAVAKSSVDTSIEWEQVTEDTSGATGWRTIGLDSDAMSKAYVLTDDASETFDGELIKQIQINLVDSVSLEKVKLKIVYQKFYMDLYDINGFTGNGPDYTPSLGKYLLDKVAEIESTVAANFKNTFAVADTATDMVEEDLTAANPLNLIKWEIHDVDTTTGLNTLMPARGSFYSNDFEMYRLKLRTGVIQESNREFNIGSIFIYTDTSEVGGTASTTARTKRVILTEENYDDHLGLAGSFIDINHMTGSPEDNVVKLDSSYYELCNVNIAKTERSSSSYAVYDTIQMNVAMKSLILITYRAFGGEVVFEDMRDVKQDVVNTIKILSSKNFITSGSLNNQPAIVDLFERIRVLEQFHNHFNQVEHSIYFGEKGFHWFNIAELYDVAWGKEMKAIDEVGTFQVESKVRGWCYEFTLGLDLRQRLENMLRCKTSLTNDTAESSLKGYVAYLEKHDDVAIRAVWNGDGLTSGVMLQLGWNFDNYPEATETCCTDTIIVTNKSGILSKWKLVYNPLDNTFVSDMSTKEYGHTKYVAPTETKYLAGVDYFKFMSTWTYYKTASTYVKEDVDYFTIQYDSETKTYTYKLLELVVGKAMSEYTAMYPNGIYERSLYNKIPRMMVVGTDYKIGDDIESDVYVVDDAETYLTDSTVELPNKSMIWKYNDLTNSNLVSCILEPNDGLLYWVGNVKLSQYVEKDYFELKTCLDQATLKNLDLTSIKKVTFRLYDRKKDRIFSKTCLVDDGRRLDNGTSVRRPVESLSAQCIIDLEDMCALCLNVSRDWDGDTCTNTIHVKPYLGTDSWINNRFDLRQIELHF